jgi:hypothetical protein
MAAEHPDAGEAAAGEEGHAVPFPITSTMFEQAFRNIDDALRKEAGCTTELDYTEQTSWLLFLKYLDALEQDRADIAALDGKKYTYILDKPYRWEAWAAPKKADGTPDRQKALGGTGCRSSAVSIASSGRPAPLWAAGWARSRTSFGGCFR